MKEDNNSVDGELKVEQAAPQTMTARDIVLTFVLPTVLGKSMIVFFGSNYSSHPGEGYGYGLVFAIAMTLTTISRFVWKYRNYEDG